MTSEGYAEDIRNKIDDKRTYDMGHYQPFFGMQTDHGTSHLAVLAPDGSAVSVTSTINY